LKLIFFTAALLFGVNSFSQHPLTESAKLASFCKVWGFLKYYHPVVSKGKFDWDAAFTKQVRLLPGIKSQEDLSRFYSAWISELGKVKDCKRCSEDGPAGLKINLDNKWMDDSTVFTPALSAELHQLVKNRNKGKKYYVEKDISGYANFKAEKAYKDSVFPGAEFRLLALSRYWNIINYFFPYKYLIGEDWSDVLVEMIPKFMEPKDTVGYHMAIIELVVKTNDGHAGLYTPYSNRFFGYKWVPFRFKVIDSCAVVLSLMNDSLAALDDIRYGDVFLKVDGISVSEVINEKAKYIPASNESSRLRNMTYAIFNGNTDSIKVTFERDGIVSEKIIRRYRGKELMQESKQEDKSEPWKMLDGNIGYVNMGTLKQTDVDQVMAKLKNTRAIIFDVRNYPKGTMYGIARHLNKKRKTFVKFTHQDLSYPGMYSRNLSLKCGSDTDDYYRGKVILLFNESTQSHAEFTCMALQTAPDVTCIGSQTAGADGNVITLTFPGGYTTWMTGLGVYYPDGRETQRIGIVPDIVVKPTIAGIRNKKDEVLERAVEFIETGR
jgi:carboxyl-terminal processing protease